MHGASACTRDPHLPASHPRLIGDIVPDFPRIPDAVTSAVGDVWLSRVEFGLGDTWIPVRAGITLDMPLLLRGSIAEIHNASLSFDLHGAPPAAGVVVCAQGSVVLNANTALVVSLTTEQRHLGLGEVIGGGWAGVRGPERLPLPPGSRDLLPSTRQCGAGPAVRR